MRNGVKETHRSIVGMLKMDTKEYSFFTNTKQINASGNYGCSKCCDTRYQLTDPQRKSFQYIRSNDHILELAGLNPNAISVPFSKSDCCLQFSDWNKKGMGYKSPPHLQDLKLKYIADPHYTITTDMYHAAKNIAQQIFTTIIKMKNYNPDQSYLLFSKMKDFVKINCIEAKITDEDYSAKHYITNISLESAPIILVEFILCCCCCCCCWMQHCDNT